MHRYNHIYLQLNPDRFKQVKAAGEKMESDLHEMSKPLTRGVDDEDRENHLKDVEHADDPMLQYMRKKRSKAEGRTILEPHTDTVVIKCSTHRHLLYLNYVIHRHGQIYIITGKTKRMPQYQGPMPAPNRFNIRPGYRWT